MRKALEASTHNANVLKDIFIDGDKDYNTVITNDKHLGPGDAPPP